MISYNYLKEKVDKNEDLRIKFFDDIIFRKEKNSFILGRENIDKYIEIPEVAGLIIEKLLYSNSINEVIVYLKNNNLEIDLLDFVYNLYQLNFIEKINNIVIESENFKRNGLTFKFINRDYLKFLNNKYFKYIVNLYFIISFLFFIIFYPEKLFVSYKNIFFSNSLLKINIVIIILDFILVFFHEFSHFFSIRILSNKLGYISLGKRYFYLVFQTRLDNIWSIKKEDRIQIYLSGIKMDIFLISIFLYLIIFSNNILILSLSKICLLLLYLGILFEFKFYLKTDIYYLISDLFENRTLLEDSKNYIFQIFNLNFKKVSKTVFIYSILYILGIIIETLILIIFFIPTAFLYIKTLYLSYINWNSNLFYSNLITVLLNLIELIILFYLYIKNKSKL